MAIDWNAEATELDHFNAEYATELAAEKVAPEFLSDEWLDENLTAVASHKGIAHADTEIRLLDTVELRKRAYSEAHTLQNLIGGIYSQRLAEASRTLADMVREGKTDDEMYGERVARSYRETDNAHRKAVRGY